MLDVAVGAPDFLDEMAHAVAILDAGRGLDAAGDVDSPRQGRQDRVENIVRGQPTRQHYRLVEGLRNAGPVERLATAAAMAFTVAVEQETCRAGIPELQASGRLGVGISHRYGFHPRHAKSAAEAVFLVTMELQQRGPHLA